MKVSQLPDGISIEVRSAGLARFFAGSFLALWLGGWAAGEGFALTMLGAGAFALFRKLVHGEVDRLFGMTVTTALLAGLFLTFWLALWTFGGVAAMYRLAQLLWGVETIQVRGGKLFVVRRAWPFTSTRELPVRPGAGRWASKLERLLSKPPTRPSGCFNRERVGTA